MFFSDIEIHTYTLRSSTDVTLCNHSQVFGQKYLLLYVSLSYCIFDRNTCCNLHIPTAVCVTICQYFGSKYMHIHADTLFA
jgi:hypothetical protein